MVDYYSMIEEGIENEALRVVRERLAKIERERRERERRGRRERANRVERERLERERKERKLELAVNNFVYNASMGDLSNVKLALTSSQFDINKVNDEGETALDKASENGHAEIVKMLLGHSDIDITKADALFLASFNGHSEIVNLLLGRADIDVNKESIAGSPLMIAAFIGNIEIVKLLLERADIEVNNNDDSEGWTPLHAACNSKWTDVSGEISFQMALLLIEKGANEKLKDIDGDSALKTCKLRLFKSDYKKLKKAIKKRR